MSALERVMPSSVENELAQKCARYVPLLLLLAYEAQHFERSVKLLIKIAVAAAKEEAQNSKRQDSNEAAKSFASLFPIHLSGTHASMEQRESLIRSLLDSPNAVERELGLKALTAALEAIHFGPIFNFAFGARSRDFGYWPATKEAVAEWFKKFLKLAGDLACSDHIEASRVRNIIADKFRGLWTSAAMYTDLENICNSISKKTFWIEGWMAVQQTKYYDSNGFAPDVKNRLTSLEARLRPQGIVRQVRSIVLAPSASFMGIYLVSDAGEDIGSAITRFNTTAYELGMSVARDKSAFGELLPELITAKSDQIWSFGRGLAQGADDPADVWEQFIAQLGLTSAERATPWIFRAFLNGLHVKNSALAYSMLDDAVSNDALLHWYPILETGTGMIDRSGFHRLMRSLDLGKAPIHTYGALVGGGVTHGLTGSDFNELLLRISDHIDGVFVAMEILVMRLSFDQDHSSTQELIEIGCKLMRRLKVTEGRDPNSAYRLQLIAKHCLLGDKGVATVREICTKLRDAISRSEVSPYNHGEFLKILFSAQPLAVLQSLCDGDEAIVKVGVQVLEYSHLLQPHTFDVIPEEELLRWCDAVPDVRYPIVAAGITAITNDTVGPRWSDLARKILTKSTDRVQILRKFIRQFSLPGWDASRADEVQSNLRLLDEMKAYSDPVLEKFADQEKIRLSQAIAAAKEVIYPARMAPYESFE